MPFISEQQRNFFGLCKGSPEKARGKCPPKRVIDEFFKADKMAQAKARQAAIAGKD